MTKMKYTQKFIGEVKKMFPDDIDLHNALDSGSSEVGTHLVNKTQETERLWYEWIMFYKENI